MTERDKSKMVFRSKTSAKKKMIVTSDIDTSSEGGASPMVMGNFRMGGGFGNAVDR